jgi:hypothetical protein|tara:strand:- start:3884 stop:4432 length:549 start_codon:yes stop_codon:yes gene_type:complete
MVKIHLFSRELAWCQSHAEEIVQYYAEKFGDKGSGSYNHNKVSSNLVGVKSELATKFWLKRNFADADIQCNYEDFKNKKLVGDINLHGRSLEIKGLRPNQWNEFKRCVPPKQLDHYVKDDAIVIWTTTSGDIKNKVIHLKGWNYAHEIKEKGVFRRTICDNIWLEADSDMREMNDLIMVLKP